MEGHGSRWRVMEASHLQPLQHQRHLLLRLDPAEAERERGEIHGRLHAERTCMPWAMHTALLGHVLACMHTWEIIWEIACTGRCTPALLGRVTLRLQRRAPLLLGLQARHLAALRCELGFKAHTALPPVRPGFERETTEPQVSSSGSRGGILLLLTTAGCPARSTLARRRATPPRPPAAPSAQRETATWQRGREERSGGDEGRAEVCR